MELNVFIIDDDHSVTEQLPCLVRNWAAHRNMNVNIVTKNDLSEVTPTLVSAFDLVMLDIEIGEENGIEFARSLRDLGSDATIAFISNFERYAIEGYSVHAVSYLLKPLKKDAVETLLDEAATRTGSFLQTASVYPRTAGTGLFPLALFSISRSSIRKSRSILPIRKSHSIPRYPVWNRSWQEPRLSAVTGAI